MSRFQYAIAVAAFGFASIASAADLPIKAPAIAVAYDWTGFYIGAHAGYGWGSTQNTATDTTAGFPIGFMFNRANETGPVGGGQIGFNYQVARWVVGLESDYSFANINGSETSPSPLIAGASETSNYRFKWLATATGRVGYTWDSWLVYAKGGGAWGHNDSNNNNYSNPVGGVFILMNGSENRSGWTIGGGLEYGFWNNWSAQLEYDYLGFGTAGIVRTANTGGTIISRNNEAHVSLLKMALNYRFNWGKK